ncbi:MAG TPA: histidine kinase [Firmicutes bacterium]|jgi:two-component system, LytTR family, sensor histidine kinase LytS|nr:histidine kinase [Bacillota bacterium]
MVIVHVLMKLLTNMSTIIMIAYLLSKTKIFKNLLTGNDNHFFNKILLMFIFAGIGILATYVGTPVKGAIANSRIIGVMVGGIYGGPFVGIGAGLIAGFHRWVIDIHGFTAEACAVSTLFEGAIGGFAANFFKNRSHGWVHALILGMFAELLQMLIILSMAHPFSKALDLVKIIWVPMVLLNPVGVAFFIGFINGIYKEQEEKAALQTKLALDITDHCLGYLRKGLSDKENIEKAAQIILEMSGVSAVAITDRHQTLAHKGVGSDHHQGNISIQPEGFQKVIENGEMTIINSRSEIGCYHPECGLRSAVIVPLRKSEAIIGTIQIYLEREKGISNIHISLARGLARIFSTQLELADIDYQKRLCQRAELKALQSQVNPHFLFNSLNTISSFCLTKPERAKKLLLSLSIYFRNTLMHSDSFVRLQDELKQITAYLELEQARFEDKLRIIIDIPEDIDCILPQFVIQPLVENAIKHGVLPTESGGIVCITATKAEDETEIRVENTGKSITPGILQKFYDNNLPKGCIGLTNVNQRLKSIYGPKYGLTIKARCGGGTIVSLRIPEKTEGDFADEYNSCG